MFLTPPSARRSVSASWISMCEALFFAMDVDGYGVIGAEEAAGLARCIVVNRVKGGEGGEGGEGVEPALAAVESVAAKLWADMQMNSDATSSRAQVKGTVTLASFKAFCLRSALGENEMALVAKVVKGSSGSDGWGKCWPEAVQEVQDNFGGFGRGLGGSPDLGVFLEVDAYNRAGGLRFGDLWKKDESDVRVREALSALASSMVSAFSRGEFFRCFVVLFVYCM